MKVKANQKAYKFRIFDRFYRVEKSRSRLHGGSGLGLWIVKKLVELHGGVVRIQSKVNIGTRVEVEFNVQASTATKGGR